jgi:hypothetical protein
MLMMYAISAAPHPALAMRSLRVPGAAGVLRLAKASRASPRVRMAASPMTGAAAPATAQYVSWYAASWCRIRLVPVSDDLFPGAFPGRAKAVAGQEPVAAKITRTRTRSLSVPTPK